MELFLANIHAFIIYSYVGTATLLALTYLLFKILKTSSPRLKAQAYFGALVVPPVTYFTAHVILNKPCQFGILPWGTLGGAAESYNLVCRLGSRVAEFLVPFFGIAMFVGVAKAIISVIACGRLAVKYGYLQEAEGPEIFKVLKSGAKELGIPIPKIVLMPSDNMEAFTFGIWQPVIVISDGLVSKLSTAELGNVLKHECAHIKRHDVLTNWLAVVLRDIAFFNPFVLWAFSLFLGEKEKASDDLAVLAGQNPHDYGTTLIKTWRMSAKKSAGRIIYDNISPELGFLKRTATLEKRVERLLNWRENTAEPKFFNLSFAVVIIFSINLLILVC
jgi:beta-lactamase regulating signal transducer with metallopeptidase domain